ncbi:transforming acidic coiled-coil-containing protein 3-like [Pseudorasbora parva]|uniref:transforming acidic coiled-coil-containing protein 3-like n=1 Tax=Pseudorasbora parva TaxID=51549 RepID=UPI00351E3E96
MSPNRTSSPVIREDQTKALETLTASTDQFHQSVSESNENMAGTVLPVTQAVETLVLDPIVLDLMDFKTLTHPVRTEDSIMEVLKYSQRDLDAALLKAEAQARERQQELQTRVEALHLENQDALLLLSEYDATLTQITDEYDQEEDFTQIQREQVLQEKYELSKDLNDLEQSFFFVVKRLGKYQEVIKGKIKHEEILKQLAQNCQEELQKGGKRFQALKAHTEEKLDLANKTIFEVRSEQGTASAALQMQLKRERLRVQALDMDLEQKAKEVEDVTALYDELLLKVQKH